MLVLGCTMLLSACLPDEKDPNKTAATGGDTSAVSGGYYASALGNAALKLQNQIVSDASWFTQTATGSSLTLADIQLEGVPAVLKTNVCPTGTGIEVLQLSWLEATGADGKFSIKGAGTDNSQLLKALRARMSADELGVMTANGVISLINNTTTAIPASCTGLHIPTNTPVIALLIERPAKPSAELARTEYQTTTCTGAHMVGSVVQKRVVTYDTEGKINYGAWTDNVGGCLQSVDIAAVTNSSSISANATLQNFANVTLKSVLDNNGQMKCSLSSVLKNGDSKDLIDCAAKASVTGSAAATATTSASADLPRTLTCGKAHDDLAILGISAPVATTMSLSGAGATLVRQVSTQTDSNGKQTSVTNWVGQSVNCTGSESAAVACTLIQDQPNPVTGAKWVSSPVGTANVTHINMDTYMNAAVLAKATPIAVSAPVSSTSWKDASQIIPNVLRSPYAITNNNNNCEWQYHKWEECPNATTADASLPTGTWTTSLNPANAFPATFSTLSPVFTGGSNAALVSAYNSYKATGDGGFAVVAYAQSGGVTYGQPTNATPYLKSWQIGTQMPAIGGNIGLNKTAMNRRDAMCSAGQTGGRTGLCDSNNYMTSGQQGLARSLCNAPLHTTTGGWDNWSFASGTGATARNYCNYIFDEFQYDLGTTRHWSYHFREMARANATKYSQTTLLNADGTVRAMRPVIVTKSGSQVLSTASQEYLVPLSCMRGTQSEVEIPLKVQYRSWYSFWANYPPVKSGVSISRRDDCYGVMISGACVGLTNTIEWHNYTTSIRATSTAVREFSGTQGNWSKPKTGYLLDSLTDAWYISWFGTSSLSSAGTLTLDLMRGTSKCDGQDGVCDNYNSSYDYRSGV